LEQIQTALDPKKLSQLFLDLLRTEDAQMAQFREKHDTTYIARSVRLQDNRMENIDMAFHRFLSSQQQTVKLVWASAGGGKKDICQHLYFEARKVAEQYQILPIFVSACQLMRTRPRR
jgi:hypothetical protein